MLIYHVYHRRSLSVLVEHISYSYCKMCPPQPHAHALTGTLSARKHAQHPGETDERARHKRDLGCDLLLSIAPSSCKLLVAQDFADLF